MDCDFPRPWECLVKNLISHECHERLIADAMEPSTPCLSAFLSQTLGDSAKFSSNFKLHNYKMIQFNDCAMLFELSNFNSASNCGKKFLWISNSASNKTLQQIQFSDKIILFCLLLQRIIGERNSINFNYGCYSNINYILFCKFGRNKFLLCSLVNQCGVWNWAFVGRT